MRNVCSSPKEKEKKGKKLFPPPPQKKNRYVRIIDSLVLQAMIVRGFRGDSEGHKIHFPRKSFAMPDYISIMALCSLIGATKLSAGFLV